MINKLVHQEDIDSLEAALVYVAGASIHLEKINLFNHSKLNAVNACLIQLAKQLHNSVNSWKDEELPFPELESLV